MNKNTSISLGTHFAEFVEQQVEDGRYASASEVVRAGLRLLEEHESYVTAVRAALIEGEESGEPQPFDLDDFLQEMRQNAKWGRLGFRPQPAPICAKSGDIPRPPGTKPKPTDM